MKKRIQLLLIFFIICSCTEEQYIEDFYMSSDDDSNQQEYIISEKSFLIDSLTIENAEDSLSLIPPVFTINVFQQNGWNYWQQIIYPTYGSGIQYGNLCFFYASANVVNYYWSSNWQGDGLLFLYLNNKYSDDTDWLMAYDNILQNGITKAEAQDVVFILWTHALVRRIQFCYITYTNELDQAYKNGIAVVGLLNGNPLHAVMIIKYNPITYNLGYYDSIFNQVVTASWNPTLFESLISY